LTTHLALRSTKLPSLVSTGSEDPLFNDDWDAAEALYPQPPSNASRNDKTTINNKNESYPLPPITLLLISINSKIHFDPSREELAVADAIVAISLSATTSSSSSSSKATSEQSRSQNHNQTFTLLSVRTIDPPSRNTTAGVPDILNPATTAAVADTSTVTTSQVEKQSSTQTKDDTAAAAAAAAAGGGGGGGGRGRGGEQRPSQEDIDMNGVWTPPRGGISRGLIARMVAACVCEGGVAEEVFGGLASSVV
jgi:exosome complex component RRP42